MRKSLEHLNSYLLPGMPMPIAAITDGSAWQIGKLRVIASWGDGWDHVSVSLQNRCPLWDEMQFIKQCFFEDEEAVMQLHPRKSDYVNFHPYCLHLWKPQSAVIPVPPTWMVGPSTSGGRRG